jgi:hypothetical protein
MVMTRPWGDNFGSVLRLQIRAFRQSLLQNRTAFISLYFTPETCGYQFEVVPTAFGEVNRCTVTGTHPKLRASIISDLIYLSQTDLQIVITDLNKNTYTVGSEDYPCRMSFSGDTGATKRDFNSLQFTITQSEPCP